MNATTDLRFAGAGGIVLAGSAAGDPGGTPVLLLHGGGQTRHAWRGTAAALAARGAYAVTLDLRGHGESAWAPDADYRIDTFVADVESVAATFATPPSIVGASLGGAIALLVAARGTVPVRAIVLVDIALQVEDAGIDRIVGFMESGASGFATLEEAADAVAAYLPHRERPKHLGGLKKNLRLGDDGRWYWHWDPVMLSRIDIGEQRTSGVFERAARTLELPVLLIRGSASDVVSERNARDFVATVPHARYVDVSGARHMVAGDENDAFTEAVASFVLGPPTP